MKYLIKDTTPEERQIIVEKALAISLADAKVPSKEVLELAYEYIDGKKELEEIQREIIEKYKKGDIYNERPLCIRKWRFNQ